MNPEHLAEIDAELEEEIDAVLAPRRARAEAQREQEMARVSATPEWAEIERAVAIVESGTP